MVKHVYLVFVTKYRKKVFTQQVMRELKLIFASLCKDFGSRLMEFDGEGDHVHLLINYLPKIPVSKLVNSLKGVSSRLLRNKGYTSIQSALWEKNLWSSSYFASSYGGAPISIIRQYIENQQSPTE